MVRKSLGIIGTFLQGALCQSLACTFHITLTPYGTDVHEADHREGYPNIRTVDYWLGGNKAERFPQSRYAQRGVLITY